MTSHADLILLPLFSQTYLRMWAKQLGVPILSVDYSLAPESKCGVLSWVTPPSRARHAVVLLHRLSLYRAVRVNMMKHMPILHRRERSTRAVHAHAQPDAHNCPSDHMFTCPYARSLSQVSAAGARVLLCLLLGSRQRREAGHHGKEGGCMRRLRRREPHDGYAGFFLVLHACALSTARLHGRPCRA